MRSTTVSAWPTSALLARRFLADYARNPVNLLMLVLVPAAFVAGASGSLAQLARLLSGTMAPGADLKVGGYSSDESGRPPGRDGRQVRAGR